MMHKSTDEGRNDTDIKRKAELDREVDREKGSKREIERKGKRSSKPSIGVVG